MIEKEILSVKFILVCYLLIFSLFVKGQSHHLPACPETDSIICTNLQVPENWKSINSRKITLPIKIYKTKNSHPSSPIFWLSGGPGQSNLSYKPPFELLKNHDVILIGYRGIDGSVVLDCPEINKALKGIGSDLLSQESTDFIKDASKACADRLLKSGVDLNGYTIEQVLLDIEAVRKYFEIEKLNFLSGSYGTRVAQLYAKFYPENIHRSVMIGASPPGHFVWEPDMILAKIDDYNILCQEDSYCQGQSKELGKTFNEVLNQMPKSWLFIPINPGKVKVVAFGMLYHKETALKVIDAFLAAKHGDYSGIALMSIAYNYIMPEMMVWGDFLSKGMIDYDHTRNYRKEFMSSESTLGSPMSTLFMDVGSVWPTQQPTSDFSQLNESRIATLVLNGALDFSTPHEIVQEELMPFLPNGRLVIFKGAGHVADLLYNAEVNKGIKKYFLTGDIEFQDLTNIKGFKVENGFPKIAKIAFGILVLVIGLIFFVLAVIFKNLRLCRKLFTKLTT